MSEQGVNLNPLQIISKVLNGSYKQRTTDEDGNKVVTTYDKNDEMTSQKTTDKNGRVVNTTEARGDSSIFTEYDKNGNMIAQTKTQGYDDDGDGIIDRYTYYEREYDESGNLLVENFSKDDDGDGIIDSYAHTDWEYDENGNLTIKTVSEDKDGDGNIDKMEEMRLNEDGKYKWSVLYDGDGNDIA